MPVRVLIVDDSATVRHLISITLRRDPEIVVVGETADPLEARQAIKALNPDVVTLDIEMPNMNGLDFLERLMRLRPMPVIMVSTLTHAGAEKALLALELGAFDCVGKPTTSEMFEFRDLAEKVKAAARSRRTLRGAPRPIAAAEASYASDGRVVAIGASTGGVEALITVLSQFPANCPPTLITQHMPATFTKSFADRLNRLCAPSVAEAEDGALLRPGQIWLAPGDMHLEVSGGGVPRCRLTAADKVNGHRPSVDVLFGSIARVFGARAIGVILTGMGRDGAEGLLSMRCAQAETVGQDESSSVVYGMPRAAFENGAVAHQMPLDRIGPRILQLTRACRAEAV
jgi:two-component system chemotaxis response regulator CheB